MRLYLWRAKSMHKYYDCIQLVLTKRALWGADGDLPQK